jgi:AraC family transcriptional regulator
MKPQFIDSPEKNVVGLGSHFISILSPDRNNAVIIPRLWSAYLPRKQEISHRLSSTDLGICTRLPDESKRTHPEEFFYLAGTEVTRPDSIPEGMMMLKVPAGRYAIFTHKGQLDALEHTMRHIYREWLPASGCKPRPAPDIETYDHRFNPYSDNSEMGIWVAIM